MMDTTRDALKNVADAANALSALVENAVKLADHVRRIRNLFTAK